MSKLFAASQLPTASRVHTVCLRVAVASVCIVFAALFQQVVAGGIYKSTDSQGNIVFTDQPLEGAETIEGEAKRQRPSTSSSEQDGPQGDSDDNDNDDDDDRGSSASTTTLLVAPEPSRPAKAESTEPDDPNNFLPISRVEILTPEHDTTLIDPLGQIWVEVQSYPTSINQSGLIAQLWMDDKLMTSDKSTVLRLPPPKRGTHVLQVKLVDKKGRLFHQSQTLHIHVKYRFAEQ